MPLIYVKPYYMPNRICEIERKEMRISMKVVEQWLCNKIYHKEIADYLFSELHLQHIAIYGAGRMGELLYDDLAECKNITVAYFIDRNADELYYGIDDMDIFNLKEVRLAQKVEAIIVTPYLYYKAIKKELEHILPYRPQIISLEDIVYKTE